MDQKFKIRKNLLSNREKFDAYKYFDSNDIIYNNVLSLLNQLASGMGDHGMNSSVDDRDSFIKKALKSKYGKDLGLYFPLKTEPDLFKFVITSGWNICLPKVKNTDMTYVSYNAGGKLIKSEFGDLYEPASEEVIIPKVALVPGLAFDIKGYRLGYGIGHFDRYFAQNVNTNIIKIGVCYDDMLFEKLPSDDHDIQMDYIITEYNIYKL